jgi:phosphoglucomutase/phosphomannomutase
MAAYIMHQLAAANALRPDQYVVTTLVSTEMTKALATKHQIRVADQLLVGFKWIGKKIDESGPVGFLFGFEESHGYLKGTHVRDKDAAVAALIFAELAATAKAKGSTVLEYLDGLYLEVGFYGETILNKTMEGREGAAQIKKLMAELRTNPPKTIAGLAVSDVYDYQTHEIRFADGTTKPLPEPNGDLLIFHLAQAGTRFAARPSGTEPKIKFYIFARTETTGIDRAGLPVIKAKTEATLNAIKADLESYIARVVG